MLQADGFAQLLETVDFLKRVQRQDERILDTVKGARRDALAPAAHADAALARSAASPPTRCASATPRWPRSRQGLRERRAMLAEARSAREPRCCAARAPAGAAPQRSLNRLLAQRAQALRAVGPGGPWSIPWPIVQCESGGQNLPPNFAGASGFYQFMPGDLARPGRLDAARLPRAEGRAGPARRPAVGRRRRRAQLGLRGARRDHLNSGAAGGSRPPYWLA